MQILLLASVCLFGYIWTKAIDKNIEKLGCVKDNSIGDENCVFFKRLYTVEEASLFCEHYGQPTRCCKSCREMTNEWKTIQNERNQRQQEKQQPSAKSKQTESIENLRLGNLPLG